MIFKLFKSFFFVEELLIDFRELIREHSGENMAEAVWTTLELYGLTRKASFDLLSSIPPSLSSSYSQIIAMVMDNASNNNTLMTSLERQCQEWGISFSARDARMRCMPHTVHLASIKVFSPQCPQFCLQLYCSL
jgi:hypothetical protein